MIRKCMVSTQATPLSPAKHFVRVTFELPSCTWADRISVCGDFNAWQIGALVMRQTRDGVWRAIVDLDPNRKYEFRYSMDGTWQTDYHADGWACNPHGSDNSVIDTGLISEGESEIIESALPLPSRESLTTPALPRRIEDAIRLPFGVGGQLHELTQGATERDVSQRAHAVRRAA